MSRNVITSADGSITFRLDEKGESFHSIAGAYEESNHIYIRNGLLSYLERQSAIPKKLNIFETGFGTGLNCLLTICNSLSFPDCRFYYCSVDKYPLSSSEIEQINHSSIISSALDYKNIFPFETIADLSDKMHKAQWNKRCEISDNFTLEKIEIDLIEFSTETKFDLFFHDAFSPETDPQLWSQEIFDKFAEMAAPGAILVTYSSKGTVKENLRNSGFTVKRFSGINGKRHNLIAQVQF